MKNKIVALTMLIALIATTVIGCGSNGTSSSTGEELDKFFLETEFGSTLEEIEDKIAESELELIEEEEYDEIKHVVIDPYYDDMRIALYFNEDGLKEMDYRFIDRWQRYDSRVYDEEIMYTVNARVVEFGTDDEYYIYDAHYSMGNSWIGEDAESREELVELAREERANIEGIDKVDDPSVSEIKDTIKFASDITGITDYVYGGQEVSVEIEFYLKKNLMREIFTVGIWEKADNVDAEIAQYIMFDDLTIGLAEIPLNDNEPKLLMEIDKTLLDVDRENDRYTIGDSFGSFKVNLPQYLDTVEEYMLVNVDDTWWRVYPRK